MQASEAARRGPRERDQQMADKKIEPKQPEKDEKAAGARKTEKTSARRVLHKKAARKSSTRRMNARKS
jgi:hypothetical protein